MKSILITMRIIFIGIFWSIFFLEGIRVILLTNWRFDIFLGRHWRHLQNLWMQGWVIDDPKEWAFVLIILTFIPLEPDSLGSAHHQSGFVSDTDFPSFLL